MGGVCFLGWADAALFCLRYYYAKFRDFAEAVLGFLRETVPQRFDEFSSTITDNFRVIDPKEFQILA